MYKNGKRLFVVSEVFELIEARVDHVERVLLKDKHHLKEHLICLKNGI